MSSSTTEQGLVDVILPALGTSITEGTLIVWGKAVGDQVVEDETICEISTDKVDSECPSPATGTVVELLVEVGETVEVGAVLARIAPDTPSAGAATISPAAAAPVAAPAVVDGSDGRVPGTSPVVGRIAQDKGVDLNLVTGTGRRGRVTKRDLLAYLKTTVDAPTERPLHSESPYRPDPPELPAAAPASAKPLPSPVAPADDLGGTTEPLSRMRQGIGRTMLRSQEAAATCHTMVECDMSRIEHTRRELGLTALPLLARATIDTLHDFGELNATLEGSDITRYDRVHLGIAVSLGADGLIVPVVRDAQDLAPEGLGRRVKELAGKARAKKLDPDDVQGATFTITNPGAAGALIATPIINVPQVAILDMEAIVRRPVVVTNEDGDESIAIRPMMNLILGWDHRVLDGIYAAQFLTALRGRLEARA